MTRKRGYFAMQTDMGSLKVQVFQKAKTVLGHFFGRPLILPDGYFTASAFNQKFQSCSYLRHRL